VAAPLLFPFAAAAGITTIHYAVVAVLATGIGFAAPPLGDGFMRACRAAQLPPAAARGVAAVYVSVLGGMLVLVAFLPLLLYG
jgi:TRAP-type C4-dicarboxylate transport system permease large subunit